MSVALGLVSIVRSSAVVLQCPSNSQRPLSQILSLGPVTTRPVSQWVTTLFQCRRKSATHPVLS